MTETEIIPGLWCFEDTCNVYVLKCGDKGLCIDFGSGSWMGRLANLGITRVTDVFLTHHHNDQCAGLLDKQTHPWVIHAPAGEAVFLDPKQCRDIETQRQEAECVMFPRSYALPEPGIPDVVYDMAANTEQRLHGLCLRFVSTPGHGPHALSIIVEFNGRQIGFSGDAVHAGATIWHPFNLEWDHWTGKGALAAWEGINRLRGIGLDLLCPSHGPMIPHPVADTLRRLDQKLIAFYRAKGSICAGEKDHLLIPKPLEGGVQQVLPHLFMGPMNAYLLRAEAGADLLFDPTKCDVAAFESYCRSTETAFRPEVALVSHAHYDHYSGIPHLQAHYGTQVCLHPRVAQAITDPLHQQGLFRGIHPLAIDRLLPEQGRWDWQTYRFDVAPWPGQTWWHAAHMVEIDGVKVLFGGDSFQPASRWNGTGGFCAANLSRFQDGFVPSARLALSWHPDILANGHRNLFRFTASRFRRIIRWADRAEAATRALCPSGRLETDYAFIMR